MQKHYHSDLDEEGLSKMAMVKDYLNNKFKHGIETGVLQFGVAQETTSPDVAEVSCRVSP